MDVGELSKMGMEVVAGDLLQESSKIRHNPKAVASVALQIAARGPAAPAVGIGQGNEALMETELTIVILAAGLGTRMKSAKAKVLHSRRRKDADRARGGHGASLDRARARSSSWWATRRIRCEGRLPRTVCGFIEQREQKGTGHALLAGREELSISSRAADGPVWGLPAHLGRTLRRLISEQRQSGAAGAVITTLLDDPTGYGRVLLDAQGGVRAIVEQKAATPEQLLVREINSGIYCFRAADFWAHIGQIRPDNPAKEYYLTDIVEILEPGRPIHSRHAHRRFGRGSRHQ